MTHEPEDRILHLALKEVLGGETPPDLADRILKGPRRPRERAVERKRLLMAACALLAVGLVVVALWPRSKPPGPGEEPLARRSAQLEVVGPQRERTPEDALQAGDFVVAREKGTVTFGGGARVDLDPGTLVLVESENAVELYAGTVRLEREARVRTHLGLVVNHADGETTVSLPAKDFEANLDLWIRDEAPRPARLTVRVATGRATLDGNPVAAGETVTRGPPDDKGKNKEKENEEPLAPPPLSEDEKKLLDSLVKSGFPDVSKFDPQTRHKILLDAAAHRGELRSFLEHRPTGWAYLRPKLLALPRAHHRAGVVDLLLRDPDPASRKLARAELQTAPADLSVDSLLLLAQEDEEDASKELARRLEEKTAAVPLVPVAVHFALRGDPRGQKTLRWFVTASGQAGRYPQLYIAAAAGLKRLGDDIYWGRVPGFVRRTMNRHLGNRRLGAARRVVACLGYFHGALERNVPVEVAYLDETIERHADAEDLKTEAQIRRKLATLGG